MFVTVLLARQVFTLPILESTAYSEQVALTGNLLVEFCKVVHTVNVLKGRLGFNFTTKVEIIFIFPEW